MVQRFFSLEQIFGHMWYKPFNHQVSINIIGETKISNFFDVSFEDELHSKLQNQV